MDFSWLNKQLQWKLAPKPWYFFQIGLWLAETFSTSSLKPLIRIKRNSTGSKISTSSTKLLFFGPIGKTKWPPWGTISLLDVFLSVSLSVRHTSVLRTFICRLSRYSWNSLTRSQWDQRKYFELSEVRVKHQFFMTVFSALKSDCQRSGYMVHTSYDVDTIYSRSSALWRRFKHEYHDKYETLFIYRNNNS